MRKVKLELLAGVAAIAIGLVLPGVLHADPAGDAPPPSHENMFKKLDTNHDGTISPDEWKAAEDARFKKMDANGDGVISRDEAMASAQKRIAERVDRMFARADTDKDGKISKAEFEAAGEKMRERAAARKGKHDGPPPGAPAGDPE
ncbi:MAG TPA: EF-hand domain-containing protein [Parvibaculum sp.]